MNHDPIKRFTLLVLCQAQQDRATELVVAPTDSERAAIRYKVDGTWYDMAPPPSHILPESLFGNYEGRCGEGFWLWPRRRVPSIPAAGWKERANAGHGHKTRRPEVFRGKG